MNQSLLVALSFAVLMLGLASGQQAFSEIEYDSEIGDRGTGDEELMGPADVVYNGDERLLYVVDSENNRINVFENDGEHDSEFGTFCSVDDIEDCNDNARGADDDGDAQFDNPTAATLDDRENLFVVDSGNGRIQMFDNGRFEMKFGSTDTRDDDYLGSPQGIAIWESEEKIFVSSRTTDAIHVFDYDGEFLFDFDDFGRDSFDNPTHLLIDNTEKILYVSDSENDQVVIFKLVRGSTCPSGTDREADGVCYVEKFGESGRGDGEFSSPSGLALDGENDLLYVADTGNDRVQSFQLIDGNTCPAETEKVADGVCFVERFGRTGSGDGRFEAPSGIALDGENDLLYVADTGNDRVQVLELNTEARAMVSEAPSNLRASPTSATSLVVSWDAPEQDDDAADVTGYKIEYKKGSERYRVLDGDTGNPGTSFAHTGLERNTSYTYRVYALSSEGTSAASSVTGKPQETTTPSGLVAEAISDHQIRLSWYAPSDTFGQSITGYEIYRVYPNGVTADMGQTNAGTRTFVVNDLATDRPYSFAVSAMLGSGSSDESDTATATPREDSAEPASFDNSYVETSTDVPSSPIKLSATRVSPTEINLSWREPADDGNSEITGYKIEYKRDSGSFVTLVGDTESTSKSYRHANVSSNSRYTYQVYAINSEGTSTASNQSTAFTLSSALKIGPIGKLSVNEERTLSFSVKIEEGTSSNVSYSLESNPPPGARINSSTGVFSWTPDSSQGGKSYTFDIVAKKDSRSDRQPVTITVNDTSKEPPPPPKEPEVTEPGPGAGTIAPFVDPDVDPQHYVDRYGNEPAYREWFDANYPEYSSIHQAVGLDEPPEIPAPFVDPDVDPQHYVDRYGNEPAYREWFDANYPEYASIYEAVGLEEPVEKEAAEPEFGECGEGTELVGDTCELTEEPREGGGCLIATAAYGSEMSSQVQMLREIRDGSVMGTAYGAAFMSGFNQMYYSFSPQIADYQRENPAFKEVVKMAITPLVASLGIMSLADSEQEVLGYGIAVIVMNAGMYLGGPVAIAYCVRRKTRRQTLERE